MRRFVLAARLAAGLAAGLILAPTAQASKATSAWWAHVAVLASDSFEGRLTGSPGYARAADYVVRQFQAAGLRPAGEAGTYLQTVRFEVQTVDPNRSSMALVAADGAVTPIRIGPEAILGARDAQPRHADAPLAFIGYGLHLPEEGYDDFAGQDLRGKIVVVLAGGPGALSPALKSHASAYAFPKALMAAGAVGVVRIPNPKAMDIPWPRMIGLSRQPGMRLAEPALQTYDRPMFSATFNPEAANLLFAGSGRSFSELLALADAHRPLPRFPLSLRLRAEVAAETTRVSSANVAGEILGSDRALKDQIVVVSAHLDHLGVGEPIQGDKVYHGAMDNASGIASLIETARAFRAARVRPRRSIVFLAVCGEEKGLLGSKHFAEHPSVPKTSIVADVNMDEFLPLFPLRHLLVLGEGESTLGADARAVALERGYDTVPDPAPDRNIFVRSDQYSFIRTGVPSIALKFQGLPGSPEAALERAWNANRYHSPQDNLDQPVDVDAAEAFDAYLFSLVRRIADEPERPHWLSGSFFRRFAAAGSDR